MTKYGMSEKLGLIAYGDDEDEVFIGRDLAHTRGYSEEKAKEIDEEDPEDHPISAMTRQGRLFPSIFRCFTVVQNCFFEKEKVHRDEFEVTFYNGKKRG